VVAAYAPSLQMRVVRQGSTPGHRFSLALAVLGSLADARASDQRGLGAEQIAAQLRIDPLQIEPILESLIQRDWVARLEEEGAQRHVLLCNPATTPAAPLIDSLLLHPDARTEALRVRMSLDKLTLAEVLG
jgi:membrane protein